MSNKKSTTASQNRPCDHPSCPNKATRKVKVNGTGGWEETVYLCREHAAKLRKYH